MDPNNQSSSVEPGRGRIGRGRQRILRYITGASNMFRGLNRVVIGEDNRPQWIIERREPTIYERTAINNEMMIEEDKQRNVERYNKNLGNRQRNFYLTDLKRGVKFEGESYFDSLPLEVIENIVDYVPRRQKVESVTQLGDRLDWDYINNENIRNISESSSEANLNSEYRDEDE